MPWRTRLEQLGQTERDREVAETARAAVFEAVHGSAPDIAGKGVANPLALLLAAALMLDHVNRSDLAGRLREAVLQTLHQDGVRTRDLGGTASTRDFAGAIVRRLRS